MKYLIACLGNIGAEYADTRHNAGFAVADYLETEAGGVFEAAHLGSVAQVRHKGRTLIILKPSTYMNASGRAVNYWLQAQNIGIANLLVVTDDIALPFGVLRVRGNGSDGGHNGMKDIISVLNTPQFARLRIGIGSDFARGRQIDYVLGKWTPQEAKALPSVLDCASAAIKTFAFEGLTAAMNRFNRAAIPSLPDNIPRCE